MRTIVPILIVIVFAACNEPGKESSFLDPQVTEPALAQVKLPDGDPYHNGNSRLIKTATYRFRVSDVKKSSSAIEALTVKYPAYISSSDLDARNGRIEYQVTIRVSNEFFNDLLKEIDKEATFTHYRNISTQDASKEFVDLESRLNTKREVEARYMEILRKKAGTIKELLEAEQQIGSLHEEIEATIRRINFLKDQVGYSTINLEFYQELNSNLAIEDDQSIGKKFSEAFNNGLNILTQAALISVSIWPILLIVMIVVVVMIKRKKTPGLIAKT